MIERTWSRLKTTTEFLSHFKAVLTPDFSQYIDMPKAMQLWNYYRKMHVGRYWIDHGLKVIPTASWSTKDSYDYTFNGMPQNSTIAVSSVGIMNDSEALERFKFGYSMMKEILTPKQVIFYGKKPEFIKDDVICIPHYSDAKFKALKEEKKNK